ncbi:CU044_5270 family protein [Blastococcus sp. TF02A-26]|uniref:CU044_5270 family protein n=1 Tax=Blastococcus sp. TF02A-26 TaxID=2250577 RepID=UPI000DEA4B53|nr:CU044_5270 family protein [Blastococcus sp. TF02A-26]
MNPVGERDELALLRDRDPFPAGAGSYPDGPLDARAARELAHLLSGAPVRTAARRRRPRLRLLLAVPVVAAAALVASLTVDASDPRGGGPAPEADGGALRLSGLEATVVLDRAATGADAQPPLVPRADQFWYMRSVVVQNAGRYEGPVELGDPVDREAWLPQGPVDGWIVEDGVGYRLVNAISEEQPSGGEPTTTYARMAQLPLDPATLLEALRAEAGRWGYEDTDLGAFVAAGDWLHTGMSPPGTVAALYRAVAEIPGVVVVEDAVDAAGRHGLGLSLTAPAVATRYEWVIDPTTWTFLGDNSYLVEGSDRGAAGSSAGGSALLARGVADSAGVRPDVEVPVP